MKTSREQLESLQNQIVSCCQCPRLVEWRQQMAEQKVARFREQEYWGRPLPGFGDPQARLLVVGLAPAAHGGNRTGRMFTGDASGDLLFQALYRSGFANQPTSSDREDGLALRDCFISAVVRCAPPENKPRPEEARTCRKYLEQELVLLANVQVIVALGGFAFTHLLRILPSAPSPRPTFAHLQQVNCEKYRLLASYHPSQRNTSTRLLTLEMLDEVFNRAREALEPLS
ncbi:MAG: uracil-DNA glycosylase [Synechococcaceae cyanobacterium SM2_3_1]|nr:uracil-DNA glycosylase [Synechococcaceae cyanobacterium SM2_3_1]